MVRFATGGSQRVLFVDLEAQRASLADELEGTVIAAVRRGDYILGEDVAAFEVDFAAYCTTDYAIGVDSGTSALELALRALEIGPGDEVILPANTFVATALAVTAAGARPVLVDVEEDTANVDPEAVIAAITPRTAAIMPVHLYGHPAEMDAICAIARRHGLAVVEDACQAHGAEYQGRRAGSLGTIAAFSFYPSKNLGAIGDAGAVVTSDAALADRVRLLRNYGQRVKYVHDVPGYNRRLDTVQASVLRLKLRHLDRWNQARRAHADDYAQILEGSGVQTPRQRQGVAAVWHLYVVRSDDRDGLARALAEGGISTGIHYPIPVHLQAAFADLGYRDGDFPVTEQLASEILSLPMYPELPWAARRAVAAAVRAHAAPLAGTRELR